MIFKVDDVEYLKTGEEKFIDKELFESMFGEKYDFETLINHEKCTERFKEVFDYWKAEGFIE